MAVVAILLLSLVPVASSVRSTKNHISILAKIKIHYYSDLIDCCEFKFEKEKQNNCINGS